MKKTITIIIAIVVVIILLVFFRKPVQAPAPLPEATSTPTTLAPQDSTTAINQDLQAIDLGELDKEFQEIDAALNNL